LIKSNNFVCPLCQEREIRRRDNSSLPKKLLEDNNSLKETGDISDPFQAVLLANSTTGLLIETIDLVILISIPNNLHKFKYEEATS